MHVNLHSKLASYRHTTMQSKEERFKDTCFSRLDTPLGLSLRTFNCLYHTVAHCFAVYYFYLDITGQVPRKVALFELFYGYVGGLGITVGCHRYWSHKTFKANLPLRILLMIMQTIAFQFPIYHWCRTHRLHHKFTDTHADPHNSKRGFWFCHIGWLFVLPHPELRNQMEKVAMHDLERDLVVRFQSRWYWTLLSIFHFLIPIYVTHYIWNLPLFYCLASNCRMHIVSLHITFCVNSVAHMWGDKPFDKSLSSVENQIVSLVTAGEGWHNYHHVFPMDYRASELGLKLNLSKTVIDFFAAIGWAYDRRVVSEKMLKKHLQTGASGFTE